MLALFVSLGASRTAAAQTPNSRYYDENITLSEMQKNATSSTSIEYAGAIYPGDAPYSTTDVPLGNNLATNPTRPNPNIGTYDITANPASTLMLTAGSLVADPPATDTKSGTPVTYTVTGARLQYRVYLKGSAAPVYNQVNLPLVGPAYNSTLYQTSGLNINLLAGLISSGTYVIDVTYQTDVKGSDNSSGISQDPSGTAYQAEFTLVAPPAPLLAGQNIFTRSQTSSGATVNNSTFTTTQMATPPGPDLGLGATFDVNTGLLTLTGGTATSSENPNGSQPVTNVSLYYRVVSPNGTAGGFNFINLPQTTTGTTTVNNQDGTTTTYTTRTFSTNLATANLLSNVSIAGQYTLQVYYQSSGTNNNTSPASSFTVTDNNNGNFYTATFTVTGTATVTTQWQGGVNDDWFNAGNWTHGVPTRYTNAEILNLGSGNTNPYPNIYSGTSYTYTANGVSTTINNTNSGPAEAHNVTMDGVDQANRSILRLKTGSLNVYGDFDNTYASYITSQGTVTSFRGNAQTITGGDFYNVEIATPLLANPTATHKHEDGIKSLLGTMSITQTLSFNGGLLVTDITHPTTSVVVLADRSDANNNGGAVLQGETDETYLQGFVQTSRGSINQEEQYELGNMGLFLTFHGNAPENNPGSLLVTRNTVNAYNPVSTTSGIRRIFGVRPSNPNTNHTVNADLVFQYLNRETKNLGSDGSISIQEQNLVLFLSTNSGNTFTNLQKTALDTVSNTLTRNNVTTFATFTLGDNTHPLPVHLVAFDAKRSGNNTLVTWSTAGETNSDGFEVQVSTDGTTYRKLAFVSSYSANSKQFQTYSYTDIEANKSGARYYRLRQVDLDGQSSFSPVRVVSFATQAEGTAAVSIYPNPSTSSDQAAIVVQSPIAGAGMLQIMDLTGRAIVSQSITAVAGVTELSVPNSSQLSSGIYLVKVTLPTGEVKTVRMQKR
ncbi:T9SS type A sorting domain-containing protein [Hymenobacter baengnokdamensis]|uniref:T9SS type A sorting domain-containing protein n=1 Tax=Hymenobacter baengnokdamensis TaxID=2615203 RepID=UPI0017868447|nr:T9SS type A sorting domain-containing protein [Hymenobacter baengnokdamensis]